MYRESQKFSSLLTLPAAFISLVFSAFVVIQVLLKIQIGNHPASNTLLISIWAITVGMTFGAYNMRLITLIDTQSINITMFPLLKKEINFADVKDMQVIAYGFVGYGIRYDMGTGTTYYNARGNMGLQLTFDDDSVIVIGTNDPDGLTAWLTSHGFMLSRQA